MKKLIATLLIGSVGCLAFAQVEMTNAPQWQVTLRVTDEGGLPIANASADAGYYIPPPPNATEAESHKTGLTDSNGIIVLTAHSGPAIWYNADKTGYYSTSGSEFDFKNKVGNQWQPWNPTLEVRLKKVINPIPMYAKSVNLGMPVFDKPAGFDLIVGDWVAPYGKGTSADILFTAHLDKRAQLDFDYKLTVNFPNKGDGIQMFSTPDNSGLRSPYEAPDNGYQPEVVRENNERPDKIIKYDNNPNGNYFVRVRTMLDENGNVKSALYGKIYGDFMQFQYYLNPTPNSRNVEFNPRQNLLGGLKSTEQVTAP